MLCEWVFGWAEEEDGLRKWEIGRREGQVTSPVRQKKWRLRQQTSLDLRRANYNHDSQERSRLNFYFSHPFISTRTVHERGWKAGWCGRTHIEEDTAWTKIQRGVESDCDLLAYVLVHHSNSCSGSIPFLAISRVNSPIILRSPVCVSLTIQKLFAHAANRVSVVFCPSEPQPCTPSFPLFFHVAQHVVRPLYPSKLFAHSIACLIPLVPFPSEPKPSIRSLLRSTQNFVRCLHDSVSDTS